MPENPAAWIMRASRNLALDAVRREKVFREKEPEIVHLMEQGAEAGHDGHSTEQEIADDRLRMMFVLLPSANSGGRADCARLKSHWRF